MTSCGGAARQGDSGGVALLTVLGGMIVLVLALLMLSAALDLAHAHARASTAADAAALAAAGTSPLAGGSGNPGEAAAELAYRNDAQLEHLDVQRWPLRVTVRVSAATRMPLVAGLVPRVGTEAAAAVIP